LLRLEGTLALEGGGQSAAINADESILAIAREEGGTTRIHLFDRPSRIRIGLIEAKVGGQPRIVFSPQQDLLLVAGTKAVQLWDVPIVPLKPDRPLAEKYRLWEQPLTESGATPQVAFSDPPTQVLWSRGSALFRREASAAGAAPEKPAWQAEGAEHRLKGFAVARSGAGSVSGVAVHYAGEKGLDLLNAQSLTWLGTLQGHRFPVAGVVPQGRGWLSLDTGWHALRWSENMQVRESTFLEGLPRAAEPQGLALLGARHVLIAVPGEGGVQYIVTGPPAWRPEDKLTAAPDGLALSPTGRYVLALEGAQGEPVKLYGFAAPEPPLDYVRHLQAAKAYRAAQGYVRLLDETGLSPKLRASLQAELSQVPASVKAQDFLERLARARRDGNADTVRHWAEEVLRLRPQDGDALAALQELKTQADRRTLNQAREALKQGRTAQAIALLSAQIPPDSPLHEEAAGVIRQAEAQRRVAGLVAQAREQLGLGNDQAAAALAQEALREDKDDAAAQSLLAELQERAGAGALPRWVPIAAGMALALAIVAFFLHRNRGRLMLRSRRAEPAGVSAWGGLRPLPHDDGFGVPAEGRPRPAPFGPAAAGARPPRRNSSGSAAPGARSSAPRREGDPDAQRPAARAAARPSERLREARPAPSPARRQVVEELLQRSEDMMRLAQQADVAREHTSLLMELEAELAAFHRRLADPDVALGPIHDRLKTVAARLRELKFARPEAPSSRQRAGSDATWYEVLQVPETASATEIKTSYHRLLKQYHPDLHNHSGFPWVREQAEQMTRRIGQAYQALANEDKRKDYDRELRRLRGAR
jgi:DnaJ-domain-containing protein 1